jgi:hypothetical protein
LVTPKKRFNADVRLRRLVADLSLEKQVLKETV